MIRHGEIPANRKKIYAGKSAEGLSEHGKQQAHNIARLIKNYNVDILYSSPVRRAVQTAELIGVEISKKVHIADDFAEMELGPWEGLSEKDISRRHVKEWEIWMSRPAELKLPGRETLEELLDRVLRGIEIICQSNHNKVVIVTHVAIIRVALLWYTHKNLNLYKTIHVPNAEIFRLEVDNPMKWGR